MSLRLNQILGGADIRSPIFYDSNDTTYYIDAASTSNLVGLTVTNTITGSVSGNAGTATVLQTARNINGTSFNGSAAITTATWGTARTLTIGSTGKSVDGSAGVSWSLAEIGALPLAGGTMTGAITINGVSDAVVVQTNGNAAQWYGRISCRNATSDKASFLGTYSGIAGVFAHNNVLNAWADLYINTVDGSGGGTVRMPSTVLINGNQAIHAGNYSGYSAFSGSVTSTYGNFASPGLIMGDAQYGFYVVSGNVYYKSASGGVHYWRNIANSANTMSLDNSGSLNLAADVRAPIFYDSNNTAYYVDAASTSVFNAFTGSHSGGSVNVTSVNGAYLGVNNTTNTNGYGVSLYNGASAGEPTYGLMFQGTGTFGTHGSVTGDWATYFTMNNDNTRGWIFRKTGGGGNTASISAGGIITASSDVRAPIFYDSNNTAFYIDQASTSVLNRLTIDGGNYANNYFQSLSDFVNGTLVTTDIPATAANGLSFVMNVVGKSYNTTTSPFNFSVQGYLYNSTIINFSGLSLDSTGLSTIKIFENGGFLCFWWARVSYWNAFEVSVRSYDTAKTNYNRVTNITDVVEPTGTKKVTVTLQTFMRADVSATNAVDLRSQIFYDTNNTAFYCDPTGTSNFTGLTVANTITGSVSGNAGTATILQTARNINGTSFNGSAAITTATWGTARTLTIGSTGKSVDGSAGVSWSLAEIGALPLSGGQITGNTTFSADNHLTFGPNSTWGSSIRIGGNGYTATGTETASVCTTDGNLHLDAAKSTNGIYLNWYGGTSGVFFGNGSSGQVASVSNTGNASFSGVVDATQFRDASNTSYYCDPASTSNLVGLTVANTITGSVSGSSASCTGNAGTATTLATARTLTIGSTGKTFNGGADVSWSTTEIVGYTPAYGTAAYQTKSLDTITTPGLYQYDGAFGGTKPPDNSPNYRTIEIGSSARFSQIAMPWNSDGYYFRRYDGTSFSTWRTVLHDGNYSSYAPTLTGTGANGSWGISVTGSSASCTGNSATTTLATKATRANGNFYIDDNYGNTVVGLYSANRYQGVFAMGDAYKLAADGTGVGTLYGIAWSHPNAGGVAANLSDHGALILLNGTYAAAISSSIRCTADMRTPIYYDSNDTAYFLNPNGSSNLSTLVVVNNVTGGQYYTGGWFRNNSSGNGLYNESTGEHFYSDASDMWNIASSQNTQGLRLRTGGYNGTVRGYFYANNSNDVGFLNNGGNWRLRIVGGDYALFDGSSIRAPIFYDSNDTNYYCDPNGTSSLAAVNANAYYPHGGVTESDIYARSLSINAYHHGDSLTYDTFQFNAASVYETRATVGASFVSGTVETSIFRGDRFGGMTIANNVYQVRWTWNGTIGYRFFKTLYISNSTNGNSFTVTIESSANGSTWTTIATTGAMSNWPGHSWYNYFWNNNATIGYIRITVTPTWVNANSMDIYSMRYFCSYALDAGARLYDWDYNRNVTFPAFIDATQFRDTNNTAYYIDAASTSNLVGLTVANTITGSITGNAGGSSASCTGNAATATILQTARNINGTSFNGSAAITTATWGTARTLTIGSTGKSVDGSANVSWSLAELGAAATNQTMFIGTTSVAINRASASQTLTGISIDGSSTSCSGNAATATTTDNINGRAFSNRDSGNGVGQDAYTNNGVGYVTGVSLFSQTDGGIHASAYSASWVHQIYGDFRTGQIAIRGRNNGTWQAWRAVLDDTNYTTYTVTKTGTGASGSWGISVTGSSASCTGNAATVTNGVYTNASNTLTGVNYFQSNLGTTSGTLNTPPLQAYATGTNAAFMSFHRAGNYAVNMGLDSDNVLRIGGWSASANRLQLDMSGNLTLAGVVDATQFRDSANTAYYVDPASTSILNLVRTRNTFGERIALNSASPQTIDTQYNVTELTLTSSISTLTFSNIQASGIVHMWTLVTVGNATVYTITWPAAVKWPGGTAPTLTTTSGKRDIYQFVTYDGGTNIYAIIVGQNL